MHLLCECVSFSCGRTWRYKYVALCHAIQIIFLSPLEQDVDGLKFGREFSVPICAIVAQNVYQVGAASCALDWRSFCTVKLK